MPERFRSLPVSTPRRESFVWTGLRGRSVGGVWCAALLSLVTVRCGGDPGDLQQNLDDPEMGAGGAGADGSATVVAPTPTLGNDPAAEPEPSPEPTGEPTPNIAPAPEPSAVDPTPAAPGAEPEPVPDTPTPVTPTPVDPAPVPTENAPATPEPAAPAGEGYLVDGSCMPECSSASLDEDGDGWGWENEASCVVADSAAAAGLDRCGGAEPEPTAVDPDTPAPTTPGDTSKPDGVESTGFYVVDGRLYDKNGNDFVIRGVNHGHYWFRNEMSTAFGAIANTGANAMRIVWETGGNANELRSALQQTVDLEMVPIIELHDVTGDESNASLLDMARYYSAEQVKQVLVDFEESLLVNIANEWSGDDWLGGYEAAINEMRSAGIHHTLVIDANGWGQNADTVLQNGQALLDLDPQHNLLFSVHMYQNFSTEGAVTAALQGAVDQQLPLMVGEFGFQHGTPVTQIPYATILSECARLGLGYMPWSWKGNSSDVSYLDMSGDWGGNSLTDWGRNVIEGENGISSTSQKASIFLL